MNECEWSIVGMTVTGAIREKGISQFPLRPAKVRVLGYAGECQGRKNLMSLSSAYAAYSEDPRFKYCLRGSGTP
jgi:hypothetical protein